MFVRTAIDFKTHCYFLLGEHANDYSLMARKVGAVTYRLFVQDLLIVWQMHKKAAVPPLAPSFRLDYIIFCLLLVQRKSKEMERANEYNKQLESFLPQCAACKKKIKEIGVFVVGCHLFSFETICITFPHSP